MAYSKNNDLVKSDEHYTPKWLFDDLGIVFDLDVASPEGGSNVPCKYYYTQENDGLAMPWFGNVWMNPPFSKPSPWVDKFLDHGNGIALLTTSTSKWFQKMYYSSAAMFALPRDFKFDRPNDKPRTISFQTMLWAIGEQNIEAIKKLGKIR